MKPLHVLHLSSESTWRGGERQIAYLIEESIQAGIKISVFCRPGSAFFNWCKEREIKTVTAPFKNGLDVKTALAIRAYASRQGVSIVHAHSGKSQSLAYLALKLGMKTYVVAHRRVDFPLKSGGPSLAKYTHPRVKAIICVSEAIAQLVREKIKRTEKVHVVHSGIDFSRFPQTPRTGYLHREFGWDPELRLVANISALAPHKDYHTFIRTAAQVIGEMPECGFLIVGDGELRGELEKLSAKEIEGDKLVFTGFRRDVPQILRELDVFLITSKTEGLGTTVIDALYNSLPVVASRAGGIPELIDDGENGFLCDVADHECLADRVQILLNDDVMRKAMGENAKRKAEEFGKDKMAEKIFGIYAQIFNNSQN